MTESAQLFLDYKRRPGRAMLERLLERHQDAVYSLCYRVLGHPQDAEDACQDVLLEVARQVDGIEQPAGFSGWLYRTALHTALDLRRRRSRRRIREGSARRGVGTESDADPAHEALHKGLQILDETSRMLVVEHYLAQRPLRELADERGCSEVAIWKRIRNARERLRQSIGSSAMAVLVGVGKVRTPAGLLRNAVMQGGLLMATKGGVKIAVLAPLVLLAGIGTAVYVTRPEPAPLVQRSGPPPTEAPSPASAPAASLPARAPGASPKPERSVAPRPYPLRLPVPGATPAAQHTWALLNSRRISLDFADDSLPSVLKTVAELTGLLIVVEAGHDRDVLSMKVKDIVAESGLRLMLAPRDFDYEIRDDGSMMVGKRENLRGGYEREARERTSRIAELKGIRKELNAGWDGLSRKDGGRTEVDGLLRSRRISVPQGETTLHEEIQRLGREFPLQVWIDDPVDLKEQERLQAELRRPFLQVVSEQSLGAHLEQIARQFRLTPVVTDQGIVLLAGDERAAQVRAEEDKKVRAYAQLVGLLDRSLPEVGSPGVPDFLDSVSRSLGLPVVPSEEAWNSGAKVLLAPGGTLRQGLDQLQAQGFRWALRDGKLFLLR